MAAPAVSGANPSHHVSSLRAHDAEIMARSRSAVLGLYAIDHRLAVARYAAARAFTAAHSRCRRSARFCSFRSALRATALRWPNAALAQRLRALYEEGDVEPIEILLGSQNLDDAMTNLDSLSRMSQESQDDLAALKAAKVQLAAAARTCWSMRPRSRCDARRAGLGGSARAGACATVRVHRLARRSAPNDTQRDRRGRRTRTRS